MARNWFSLRLSLNILRQLLISVLAYLRVESKTSRKPKPAYMRMLAAGSNSLAIMSIIYSTCAFSNALLPIIVLFPDTLATCLMIALDSKITPSLVSRIGILPFGFFFKYSAVFV